MPKKDKHVQDIFLSQHNEYPHICINCIGLLRLPSVIIGGLCVNAELYSDVTFYVLVSEYCIDYKTWQEKLKDYTNVQVILCPQDKIPEHLYRLIDSVMMIRELWHKQIKPVHDLLMSRDSNYCLEFAVPRSHLDSDEHRETCHSSVQNHDFILPLPAHQGEKIILSIDSNRQSYAQSILYGITYMQTVMGLVQPKCSYVIDDALCANQIADLSVIVDRIQRITKAKIDLAKPSQVNGIFSSDYDILIMPRSQARWSRDVFLQGCGFYDQMLTRQIYCNRWRKILLGLCGLTKDLKYLSGYMTKDYYAGEVNLQIINMSIVMHSICDVSLIASTANLSLTVDLALYNTKLLLHKYIKTYNKIS